MNKCKMIRIENKEICIIHSSFFSKMCPNNNENMPLVREGSMEQKNLLILFVYWFRV